MPVMFSTPGLSTSRKPWLLGALLAAAMLVGAPQPASAKPPCIKGDVKDLEALLRHALGSPGKNEGNDIVDTAQWQTTENAAGCAVQGLAHLFANPSAVVSDKTFKEKYFSMSRAGGGGDQVTAWIQSLRKNFGQTKSALKVLVRGNGPAGLASAIYARKAGADVTVHAERFRYTRQHVVTLKAEAGHDRKLNGMSRLLELTGLIAITGNSAKEIETIEGTAKGIRAVVPVQVMDGRGLSGQKVNMQISSLELWLHLCAVVAGAKFVQVAGPRPLDPGAQVGRDESRVNIRRDVAASWTNEVSLPAVSCETAGEETYDAGDLRRLLEEHRKYDLVVGADGANSITRKVIFGSATAHEGATVKLKDQFFSRTCPASAGSDMMDDASLFFRTSGTNGKADKQKWLSEEDLTEARKKYGESPHSGLAIAAFIVRGKTKGSPCAFFTDSANYEAILNVFTKAFKPSPESEHEQFCHVELIFKPDYGYRFAQMLPPRSGCTFNFNVVSPDPAGGDMTPETRRDTLRLLANLLAAHTVEPEEGTTKEDQVKDILSRVTEFKFFDNRMRVSMQEDQQKAMKPRLNIAEMNPLEVLKRWTPLVRDLTPMGPNDKSKGRVLLVGDAVRDANPDTGTGANDAHHGAEAIGEVLKEWHAAALIANETSLTCALQKDAKGGLEAFQASTGPLGSMTTVGLSADKTLEMEYDPKKTPPSICVTRK